METKPKKLRTNQQSKALHLMFCQLANELNDRGLTVMKTLRQDAEILWSDHLVKELIWRTLQEKITGKKSTTVLTTKEINQVFEVIAKYMAEHHGVAIEFPSIETILNRQDWYELGSKLKEEVTKKND